jgi:hypothetical protein
MICWLIYVYYNIYTPTSILNKVIVLELMPLKRVMWLQNTFILPLSKILSTKHVKLSTINIYNSHKTKNTKSSWLRLDLELID